jgi:hypothetical protein
MRSHLVTDSLRVSPYWDKMVRDVFQPARGVSILGICSQTDDENVIAAMFIAHESMYSFYGYNIQNELV